MAINLSLAERFAAAMVMLDPIGQDHVLHFYGGLDDVRRDKLLGQIEAIDWPEVARLIETHVKQTPPFHLPENLEPAPWFAWQPGADQEADYKAARAIGEQLIADGQVAAFTVAGGQGTRLGWEGPKGTFLATPIRQISLFACFAEYLRNIHRRYGEAVPWYIMTSPANHEATGAFFAENSFFDLDPEDVNFFPQAMMPAIDLASGKVLLEATDSLALSPNGHGGSLKALHTSGAIGEMQRRGVTQISYTQVDNPLVRMIDPLFLGLHVQNKAQMSSKMLPKVQPLEKLGNFCLADGKVTVIEYSDLPDELAHQRLPDGELRFRAGSTAIHAIDVDFVEALNSGIGGGDEGFALPFHRAEKTVAYVDLDSDQLIEPATPNAVKLEAFVFDALPLCDHSIIYETDRVDEFAPIKNADGQGAVDCAATSKQLQTQRAGRWLEQHGVNIAHNGDGQIDATIEISQITAIEPDDLSQISLPKMIGSGAEVLL
jgi:UDP-N-acetylglucosamine/UDP-N-acetylgalactosamine diphosphorylase